MGLLGVVTQGTKHISCKRRQPNTLNQQSYPHLSHRVYKQVNNHNTDVANYYHHTISKTFWDWACVHGYLYMRDMCVYGKGVLILG